jgi:hypothetical protein
MASSTAQAGASSGLFQFFQPYMTTSNYVLPDFSNEDQTLIQTLPSSSANAPLHSKFVRRKTTISYATPSDGEDTSPHPFTLRRAATTMLIPERRVGPAPGALQSLKSILFASCALSFLPYQSI